MLSRKEAIKIERRNDEMYWSRKRGASLKELAAKFSVSTSTISAVCNRLAMQRERAAREKSIERRFRKVGFTPERAAQEAASYLVDNGLRRLPFEDPFYHERASRAFCAELNQLVYACHWCKKWLRIGEDTKKGFLGSYVCDACMGSYAETNAAKIIAKQNAFDALPRIPVSKVLAAVGNPDVVKIGEVVIYDPNGEIPVGFGETEADARYDAEQSIRGLGEPPETVNGMAFVITPDFPNRASRGRKANKKSEPAPNRYPPGLCYSC